MALYEDDIYEDEYMDDDEWREALEERRWSREHDRAVNRDYRQLLTESAFVAGPDYVKPQYAKEITWLVEGFLPAGSLTILGATSKSGKTCLATALAMAVAKGEPFLGMETLPVPILWCAFEESRMERWRLMGHFGDPPPNFYTTHADLKIDDDFGLEVFEWWIDQLGQPLIVIDPLFGATDGNLADDRAARRALIGLKRRAGSVVTALQQAGTPMTVLTLAERCGMKPQTLRNLLAELLRSGQVTEAGHVGRHKTYVLNI